MAERYLIAIASYRRPSGLTRLLDSIAQAVGSLDVDILVVDNDAEGSARNVCETHPASPQYFLEPVAGIAAARNKALDQFGQQYHAIVFVDDDEWVKTNWLSELVSYATISQADVVLGHVETVYPASAPDWLRKGGFYKRPTRQTGKSLLSAPTNNTLLLRSAWVRAGSPRFDPAFSSTGGSDTDFFWGIRKRGGSILFCAEAVVFEEVQDNRISIAWLRKRAIRNGIVDTRVHMKHEESLPALFANGVLRGGYGIIFLLIEFARGRGIQAKPFNNLFIAIGRFAALTNYRINEYSRPSQP